MCILWRKKTRIVSWKPIVGKLFLRNLFLENSSSETYSWKLILEVSFASLRSLPPSAHRPVVRSIFLCRPLLLSSGTFKIEDYVHECSQ